MKSDIDPDVFLSKVFQIRDELIDLGEDVSDERLTTIILDELPEAMYSIIEMQPKKTPSLDLRKLLA